MSLQSSLQSHWDFASFTDAFQLLLPEDDEGAEPAAPTARDTGALTLGETGLDLVAEGIDAVIAHLPFVEAPAQIANTLYDWSMPLDGAGPLDRLAKKAQDALTGQAQIAATATEMSLAPAATPLSAGPTAADFTGEGEIVVVIDDGYSDVYDQSSTVAEYDFAGFFNDPSAETFGTQSHGSWVAQTVLDEASGVQIVHLKVFSERGGGASLFDIQEALDAVIEVAEQISIAAVNLSLGFGNATEETLTGLSDEFAELDDLGVFSIVAAGNSGQTYDDGVNVLAADPNVIGVSATDEDGEFASFSQTSETLTDIAALGVDVEVETVSGLTGSVSGTSFAAPTISGIAARLQEASETLIGERLTDEEFLEILQVSGAGVEDTGADAPDGWRIADGDAAVDYFIANASDYGELLIA